LFFAADGRSLWAADSEGRLRAWELPSGKALETPKLESPAPGDKTAAFSLDGKRLALGSWEFAMGLANAVRVWDLADGKQRTNFPGHRGSVSALAFTPDGRRLASGGDDATLIWDVGGRRVLRQWAGEREDASAIVTNALAFGADGALIAAGREDGSVVVRETETGDERFRSEANSGPVMQILLSADGRRLAGLSRDAVLAWEVPARGRKAGEPSRLAAPEDRRRRRTAQAIGLFGPGSVLTIAYRAEAVRWDTASGKELARTGRRPGERDEEVGDWTDAAALSPDVRLLAVGSDRGALAVWELATGEEVLRLQRKGTYKDRIYAVAFDPSGRLLAAGQEDGLVRVWSVASGKELARWKGHTGWALAVAFSPDGRVLASGGADTTVLLWDAAGLGKADRGAGKLKLDEREERWRLLAGAAAAAAHRAAAELEADPDRTTPFLAERLKAPPPSLSEREIDRLIADLDAEEFAVRERASAELRKAGAAPESALRRAERSPSAEVRRRVGELLEALQPPQGVLTGEAVQSLRALRVLEQAGTPESRRLLRVLAKEGRTRQVQAEAQAALERLERLAP
jgi:WD40 repeat protein